jgi:catechol 2,3-dioxygenase-like lactoylglutathione lyase family enzyme
MRKTHCNLRNVFISWCFASLSLLAQRPAITGISHVVFYADDPGQSTKFYGDLLGWIPQPATSGKDHGIRFYANATQYVELLPPPVLNQSHRLNRVAFATTDAEALRVYLRQNGIAVPKSVSREPDGSLRFIIADPENNPVEFTQNGTHKPATPSQAQLDRRLSTHIMHAGYVVHNRAALDHFYKDLLGFHLYWQGWAKPGSVDWVMMQVPNGSDWIEYMLYLPEHPSRQALASADHIAPGVDSVAELQHRLQQRGWVPPSGKDPKVLGVDGKYQLDLNDPDGTRIEFMEFTLAKTPCCATFTGAAPKATPIW